MSETKITACPIFRTAKGMVMRYILPSFDREGKEPMARAPNKLSASDAVKQMADKRLKARDLVEACLDRIDAREGQVHAWEAIDAEGARKRADMLDKRAK